MDDKEQPSELTGAQKFFALVARLRMLQKQFFKVHYEISKEQDARKLADLKAQKAKLLDNSKAIEKLVDSEIEKAENYYDKHNLIKFWL